MTHLRTYGTAPYSVAVLHGGPGAAGEMAPVARELSGGRGVLEPLQTAASLEGQVEELRAALSKHAQGPVTLVGFSWGAWLGVILTSRYPELVKKLILVGCGPFQESDAAGIDSFRMGRLTAGQRAEVKRLMPDLKSPSARIRDEIFTRLGTILSQADAFDSTGGALDEVRCSADIFQGVWPAAEALRRQGGLLSMAATIACPVVAIHGDYDPHPAEGVRNPLSACLTDFRFILLAHCGHKPWMESQAKALFYKTLKAEL
ncbi:alpha/beta hydrolase [Desulfoluna sp.]|uniref:alpha/beta fold hydrolase n=1 Tax=Desulfoluna sp. TaxID=2045199 RepID=UPI002604B40B|nr:alpha/beta hydrolase [Desulfoluna sp.]